MANRLTITSLGSGPTLLCLHGLGGGAHWFHGVGHRLQDRLRVVSLDLPGTGENRECNAPFTLDGCLRALAELIREQPGPISLLGHSLGAILALKLNAMVPGRVCSLILVGGLPEVTPSIRIRLQERREKILRTGMRGIGRQAVEGVFSPKTRLLHPIVTARFASQLDALPPEEYLEVLDSLLSASAAVEVRKARLPCLVVSGRDDTYAPPRAAGAFARDLPGRVRRVLLSDCGHLPFLERPALLNAVISRFLKPQVRNWVYPKKPKRQEALDIRL